MIQRIQSIYFMLASIAALGLLWCPSVLLSQKTDGMTAYSLTALGLMNAAGETEHIPWGMLVMTIAAVILPLVTLMSYKNRKRQMQLAYYGLGLLVLICVTLATYGYSYSCGLDTRVNIGAGISCPILAGLFIWLGRNGVRKDEELIRSTERFRV